ncbi:hypothetical protein BayCH28_21490 [Mycolicibacterium sp. CH28]|uniref:hypothetical protein n=1 Tax=Mycolicibacterium sp. CH28 TaxID=2512237 RepID=UPI0010816953|nr:hypothetical protein [Mycolicibacterium sp. CH28]TGD85600.1 hypothetical protein BayCH28_21490 [Mycolicibacterium sp. CH28]
MSIVSGLGSGDEVLALAEPGRYFGDMLDIGRSDAVLLVVRVADDCAIIALEISPESLESACRQARRGTSRSVTLAIAEISQILGYGSQWAATLGVQLPASSQGIARFAVELELEPIAPDAPSPAPSALRELIGRGWSIDHVRTARISRPLWSDEVDFEAPLIAWLLSVHRER